MRNLYARGVVTTRSKTNAKHQDARLEMDVKSYRTREKTTTGTAAKSTVEMERPTQRSNGSSKVLANPIFVL